MTKERYGISGHRWAHLVMAYLPFTKDILDYGCGKRTLEKQLGFPIQNYDPGIPECDVTPVPADIVVCGDVLEHIEPDCLDDVLDDIARLTKKVSILIIATFPARKHFPDGRNLHLIVESPEWWKGKLKEHFRVYCMYLQKTTDGDEIVAYVSPKC